MTKLLVALLLHEISTPEEKRQSGQRANGTIKVAIWEKKFYMALH